MMAMIPFKRTCKEVAALVVAREDRALPLAERLALRLHMSICACCPKFERQILSISQAMRQWRAYGNDAAEGETHPGPAGAAELNPSKASHERHGQPGKSP